MKEAVIIVGGGPAGLATAACLNVLSMPNVVLEGEDCYAHLWKKKAYNHLKLHLAKEFCALPHMPHSTSAPTYISRDGFVRYRDEYVAKFNVNPICNTPVESAAYDEGSETWSVRTRNVATGEEVERMARFLVVATGENTQGFIPDVPGLKSFDGDVVHSSQCKSRDAYKGKSVLVVGSRNSGMEIAYDLSNFGAKTCISVRSPFHVMTRGLVRLGMSLARYLPVKMVDSLVLTLCWFTYGDLSKSGIGRPSTGPLALKTATGKSVVIDVGTVGKIKTGEIQDQKVVAEPVKVSGNEITFRDSKTHQFDAIVFATGYKSTARNWLRDEECWLLNQDGFPKERHLNHWKGKNGLYCVGLGRRGLSGIAMDAESTTNDIAKVFKTSDDAKNVVNWHSSFFLVQNCNL